MANHPQGLAQDAVCQSHTSHMTGLWFLPTRPLRLNTNEWMNEWMSNIIIQISKFQYFCNLRISYFHTFDLKLILQYLKLETKVQSRHREVCNWTHYNWLHTRKNWGNTVSVRYGLSVHGHDKVIMTNGHKKWLGHVSVNHKHKYLSLMAKSERQSVCP